MCIGTLRTTHRYNVNRVMRSVCIHISVKLVLGSIHFQLSQRTSLRSLLYLPITADMASTYSVILEFSQLWMIINTPRQQIYPHPVTSKTSKFHILHWIFEHRLQQLLRWLCVHVKHKQLYRNKSILIVLVTNCRKLSVLLLAINISIWFVNVFAKSWSIVISLWLLYEQI